MQHFMAMTVPTEKGKFKTLTDCLAEGEEKTY